MYSQMLYSFSLRILIIIGLAAIATSVFAQSSKLSSKKKRALKQYELAMQAYDRYDFENSEVALLNAIKFDSKFIEAHIFLSQVYQVTNRIEMAIDAAHVALSINPNFFPNLYFNLGNLYLKIGDYERSKENLLIFLDFERTRAETRETATLLVKSCEFALHALNNPIPFTPINLGPNINSKWDEYWPSLSANENTLVITVKKPIITEAGEHTPWHQEDFYISNRNSMGEWQPVENIGAPINTLLNNEGAQSLTADGQMMYYTICQGFCNLYVSERNDDGNWKTPRALPEPVNLMYSSEKQPSISPDGKTLYFVSNRGGGYGEYDIWRSHQIDENKWSKPENLGDSINTRYNEQSPFIHFDNQTLYFSSNGHVGMGGLDIFLSRMINDSTWTSPVNLGYPINTHRDEDGLIVNATGNMAYYSSGVNPEMGRDIFKFEIPIEIRPTPTSYITGTITDARSGWPIKANFSLIDVETDIIIMSAKALANGSFLLPIPTNRSYAFFASSPGYLFHSEHFNLTGIHSADKPYRKDIELRPIRVGATIVMRNIFFETDSYELKAESITEINKLMELLALNPKMKIEVGGHTDNVGSANYNLNLSENRAKAVTQFLVSKGIDSSRLTWKGYGLTKPIGDNSTEEGRASNRRTEIRVIEM